MNEQRVNKRLAQHNRYRSLYKKYLKLLLIGIITWPILQRKIYLKMLFLFISNVYLKKNVHKMQFNVRRIKLFPSHIPISAILQFNVEDLRIYFAMYFASWKEHLPNVDIILFRIKPCAGCKKCGAKH